MPVGRTVRSFVFHIYFYTVSTFLVAVYLPALMLPDRVIRRGFKQWGQAVLWGLKVIVGLKVHLQGMENRPRSGALLACKHQSAMETSVLFCLLDKPCLVLKKELTYLPFVGLLVRKAGLIVVDRKGGVRVIEKLVKDVRNRIDQGFQVLIFPEGTRKDIGEPADYKKGIGVLYSQLGVPCYPIALNTGVFWPTGQFSRYGGVCVFSFLKPIGVGIKRDAFLSDLSHQIETKTDELVEKAVIKD